MAVRARIRREGFEANLRPFLAGLRSLDDAALETTAAALEQDGLSVDAARPPTAVLDLARAGFVEFEFGDGALTLIPLRTDFALPGGTLPSDAPNGWKLSKFAALAPDGGHFVARSPLADSKVRIHDPRLLLLLQAFARPAPLAAAATAAGLDDTVTAALAALAHALVILPCDAQGRTIDDVEPHRRQWDAEALHFHAASRLGRSGPRIGATWRFRGEIDEPPAVRNHPWTENTVPLYRPEFLSRDMTLFEAMESRRSIRRYSALPLTGAQLGEFLFRTMRIRSYYQGLDGARHVTRPYPNGGALYEQELYVTVDACTDIARGVYYYDALAHALCPVTPPGPEMAGLIAEAVTATANTGYPQILFTIASRFDRFNWKYSGMAYAAQLKNIGVIYQTMYLVATAMGIGGCALGLGNADRFARITGRNWLEEGSIGEFMIGRPA